MKMERQVILKGVAEYVKRNGLALAPSQEALATEGIHIQNVDAFLDSSVRTFKTILEFSDVHRDSAILDFGCGLGRVAIPFSGFLSESGFYVGIDIQKSRVEDCRRRFDNIPNFDFYHFDQANLMYNPGGAQDEELIMKGLPNLQVDMAILFSVFTHVLPDDSDAVLRSINRMLKQGGSMLATFFVINEATDEAMAAGKAERLFTARRGDVFVQMPRVPHHAVAYPAGLVEEKCSEHGFKIEKFSYGTWSGYHAASDHYQDLFLLQKVNESVSDLDSA